MTCNTCFNNCTTGITSDQCVKYTGDDITSLGICNGIPLSQLEAIILQKIQQYSDATGITLNSTITCQFLIDILGGANQTLANLVQMLIDGECSLRELIADIQSQISSSASFDTQCLGITSDSNKDEILQATITKVCAVSTVVDTINTTYVKNADVCTLVTQCIAAAASTQEYTKMPKYVALPYHGPLSAFDSNGKGLASVGYDKVYLCIGQTVNGFPLPDYRGRSPLGANVNVPTGGMDTNVNPALIANSSYGIGVNAKRGAFTHVNTIGEMPIHTHTESSSSFNINIPGQRGGDNGDHNNVAAFAFGDKSPSETSFNGTLVVQGVIPASTTGATGGGQSHNILAPVVGANFIMYVP